MSSLLIKILSIFTQFSSFILMLELLNVYYSSKLVIILACCSMIAPILDFGYSKYSCSKILKGFNYKVIVNNVVIRILSFLPFIMVFVLFYSFLNNVDFYLLIVAVILSSSPLILSPLRYNFIFKEKYFNSVLIEFSQPFIYFSLLVILNVLLPYLSFNEYQKYIICYSSFVISHFCCLIFGILTCQKQINFSMCIFKVKYYKVYFKTISVSIEQFLFSLWMWLPVFIYNLNFRESDLLNYSVFQKLIAITVALYSVFSMPYLKKMVGGKFVFWGIPLSAFVLFIGNVVVYFYSNLEVMQLWMNNIGIEFVDRMAILLIDNYIIVFSLCFLFAYLHIQSYLLVTSRILYRLKLSLLIVFLSLVFNVILIHLNIDLMFSCFFSLFSVVFYFSLNNLMKVERIRC